jgi:hypothetical protein
MKISKFAI